jgi:hypothetical protein
MDLVKPVSNLCLKLVLPAGEFFQLSQKSVVSIESVKHVAFIILKINSKVQG